MFRLSWASSGKGTIQSPWQRKHWSIEWFVSTLHWWAPIGRNSHICKQDAVNLDCNIGYIYLYVFVFRCINGCVMMSHNLVRLKSGPHNSDIRSTVNARAILIRECTLLLIAADWSMHEVYLYIKCIGVAIKYSLGYITSSWLCTSKPAKYLIITNAVFKEISQNLMLFLNWEGAYNALQSNLTMCVLRPRVILATCAGYYY